MQSNEVGGSYHMEKEGLNRVMQFLSDSSLPVDSLITDRHRQIAKWLRESYPAISHYYDVWHVAKGNTKYHNIMRLCIIQLGHFFIGVRKKLQALAKNKGCELVGEWEKALLIIFTGVYHQHQMRMEK